MVLGKFLLIFRGVSGFTPQESTLEHYLLNFSGACKYHT